MDTVTIPREEYELLKGFAVKVEQIEEVIHAPFRELVRKRLAEVVTNPSIVKTEVELDEYLRKRGVQIG